MTPLLLRPTLLLSRLPRAALLVRGVQTTSPTITKPNVAGTPNASATNAVPTDSPAMDGPHPKDLAESVEAGEAARHTQAPNRATTWSRSQRSRAMAMVGPRFEQTNIAQQPAPWAAIDLIHQQPVRWSESRVVACDGGGGPSGHPRVFINVDKPEVTPCGYCGLPFAHVKNRKHLEQHGASYPLE